MFLDLLKSVDYGGYYFFGHLAQNSPLLNRMSELGDIVGSDAFVCLLLTLTLGVFSFQGNYRAALVVLVAFALTIICLETMRVAVGARRPEDAQNWLSNDEMARSFPARAVFALSFSSPLLVVASWQASNRYIVRLLLAAGLAAMTLWVALSELVLGLNFVSDVMAGLFGGGGAALLTSRFIPAVPPSATARQPISPSVE